MKTQAMKASTIAEFFIGEEGVRVELEMGLGDLQAFGNMLPDELYERLGHEPRPLRERLAEFFARDMVVALPGGEPVGGRVTGFELRERIVRDEVTGEGVPSEGEPESVIFAVLEYPLETPPEGLILSGPGASQQASVGFVAYHMGLPVNDFRYLGSGYQLDLDWQDPWYSRFRTRNLRRTYDAPMSGFIYIEPYEVRKEIIVRPRDLQTWVDLGLEGKETIPAAMQPEITRRVADFLRGHQRVLIDGREIEPELARSNFLRRTLRNSTVVDPPEDLDAISATMGVIFVYPTQGLPDEVTMEWDLFLDRMERVPVASVDQAGPFPGYLTVDDNILVWQNFLKNPILPTLVVTETPPGPMAQAASWLFWPVLGAFLAAGLAVIFMGVSGRGVSMPAVASALVFMLLTVVVFWSGQHARLSDARVHTLVSGLLHNVYLAFDYRDEERIYDVLAHSVEGDLLTDIYLETRKGLEIQNQGGARAKVKKLELIDLESRPGPGGGLLAQVVWDVTGSVGHWGHIHGRSNRYRASLGIRPVDGVWKLISLDLLEEERLPVGQ